MRNSLLLSLSWICVVTVGGVARADVVDAEWDFTGGQLLGWYAPQHFASLVGSATGMIGITNGNDPFLYGPSNMNITAARSHYLVIRMRARLHTGSPRFFAYTPAQVYFSTAAEPGFDESKRLSLTTYGTDRWYDYTVYVGDHAKWTGTLRRLRFDPVSLSGVRVEIARIALVRDTTPPTFELNHAWNPRDGSVLRDTSPTLRIFDYFDAATGLARAEFYYQRVDDGVAGPWVLDGVDDATVTESFESVSGFDRAWSNSVWGGAPMAATTAQAHGGARSLGAANGAVRSIAALDLNALGFQHYERFSAWFYDTMTSDGIRSAGVSGRVGMVGCGIWAGQYMWVGLAVDGELAPGSYHVAGLSGSTPVLLLNGPNRSPGWHYVEFIMRSGGRMEVVLNGVSLGVVNHTLISQVFLLDDVDEGGSNTNGAAPDIYFDDLTWVDTNRWYDATMEDGFWHTYDPLPPGVYNFAARMTDLAENSTDLDTPAHRISNVVIAPTAETRIIVDGFATLGPVNHYVMGNNMIWSQGAQTYDNTAEQLFPGLRARIDEMGMPIARYPGGCFSDTFYWKQSIGPLAQRPDQFINGCNPNLYNAGPARFGLDEFLRTCEQLGSVPLISLRYRCSLDTPQEFQTALQDAVDLVEYCRSPVGANVDGGTDWALVRAQNGRVEPYDIIYFELGNEPWGPDPFGNIHHFSNDPPTGNDPASVAERTRNRGRTYMMDYFIYQEAMKAIDPAIQLIAAGIASNQEGVGIGDRDEMSWDQAIYQVGAEYVDAIHEHPYYPYSGWGTNMTSVYWETQAVGRQLDLLLQNRRRLTRQYAPGRLGELRLFMSEHNINYSWNSTTPNYTHTRALKSAIALADAFGVYLRNSDVVHSGQYWHLFGSGAHGVINAGGPEGFWRMATFYPFRIFNHHFSGELLDAWIEGVDCYDYIRSLHNVLPSHHGVPYLSAYAARDSQAGTLDLVVVNRHLDQALTAAVDVRNYTAGEIVQAEIWTLNGPSVESFNTASSSPVVMTVAQAQYAPAFVYQFPAHSVTSFRFTASQLLSTPTPTATATPTATPTPTSASVLEVR